jgi:hypothetical protein
VLSQEVGTAYCTAYRGSTLSGWIIFPGFRLVCHGRPGVLRCVCSLCCVGLDVGSPVCWALGQAS